MLEHWIQSRAAAALGWTLAHSLWQGAIAALALMAIVWLTRSARVRYGAACLALLALFASFVVTFAIEMQRPAHVSPAKTLSIPAAPRGVDAPPQRERSGWPDWSEYLPWLAPFWIAGVVVFQLRSAANWMAARRLRRRGVCIPRDSWQSRLDRLRDRLRVSKTVTLLESALADVPLVIGYLRPVILMPAGLLTGLPAAHVEAILLHELAHIRRHDYLINVLQAMIEGLLFYHPAAWWISSIARAERENCCDDLVVAAQGDAYEYAAALAALEQNRNVMQEAALAATGGTLMKRIRRLLSSAEGPRPALTPLITGSILVIALTGAFAVAQTQRTPPPASSTAYERWVNEDVVYIIKPEERAAFEKLTSDDERKQFIEQFWLRRDPTPGTPENEFKDEYYRRIARANERFVTATLTGWKTDRGRIYIVFGPPDEIESHRSGGIYQRSAAEGGGTTTTYPFEAWLYRYIDGVGNNVKIEFVDRDGSGAYRMVTSASDKESLALPPGAMPAPKPWPTPSPDTPSAGASVHVTAGISATVSVPLQNYGNHRVGLYGTVVDKTGRQVATFEDSVQGPAQAYAKSVLLAPGSYHVDIVVQDSASGTLATDSLNFQVN